MDIGRVDQAYVDPGSFQRGEGVVSRQGRYPARGWSRIFNPGFCLLLEQIDDLSIAHHFGINIDRARRRSIRSVISSRLLLGLTVSGPTSFVARSAQSASKIASALATSAGLVVISPNSRFDSNADSRIQGQDQRF